MGQGSRLTAGLRAQILVALSIAFLFAFLLLGFAVLELAARYERSLAQTLGQTLIAGFDANYERGPRTALRISTRWPTILWVMRSYWELNAVIKNGSGDTAFRTRAWSVSVAIAGVAYKVWLSPGVGGAKRVFRSLFIAYASVTGLAMLILTYIFLTVLIVRPVEKLTYAARQVGPGQTRHACPNIGCCGDSLYCRAHLMRWPTNCRPDRNVLERRPA